MPSGLRNSSRSTSPGWMFGSNSDLTIPLNGSRRRDPEVRERCRVVDHPQLPPQLSLATEALDHGFTITPRVIVVKRGSAHSAVMARRLRPKRFIPATLRPATSMSFQTLVCGWTPCRPEPSWSWRESERCYAMARSPFFSTSVSRRRAGPPGFLTPRSQSDTRFFDTFR